MESRVSCFFYLCIHRILLFLTRQLSTFLFQVEINGIFQDLFKPAAQSVGRDRKGSVKSGPQDQDLRAKFVGLDTQQPIVQIGNQVFAGTYEHTLGTSIFFTLEHTSPATGVNTILSQGNTIYQCLFNAVLLEPTNGFAQIWKNILVLEFREEILEFFEGRFYCIIVNVLQICQILNFLVRKNS